MSTASATPTRPATSPATSRATGQQRRGPTTSGSPAGGPACAARRRGASATGTTRRSSRPGRRRHRAGPRGRCGQGRGRAVTGLPGVRRVSHQPCCQPSTTTGIEAWPPWVARQPGVGWFSSSATSSAPAGLQAPRRGSRRRRRPAPHRWATAAPARRRPASARRTRRWRTRWVRPVRHPVRTSRSSCQRCPATARDGRRLGALEQGCRRGPQPGRGRHLVVDDERRGRSRRHRSGCRPRA